MLWATWSQASEIISSCPSSLYSSQSLPLGLFSEFKVSVMRRSLAHLKSPQPSFRPILYIKHLNCLAEQKTSLVIISQKAVAITHCNYILPSRLSIAQVNVNLRNKHCHAEMEDSSKSITINRTHLKSFLTNLLPLLFSLRTFYSTSQHLFNEYLTSSVKRPWVHYFRSMASLCLIR